MPRVLIKDLQRQLELAVETRNAAQRERDQLALEATQANVRAVQLEEARAQQIEQRGRVRAVATNEELPQSVRGAAVDWLVRS